MQSTIPVYLSLAFSSLTIITVWLFFRSVQRFSWLLLVVVLLALQGAIGATDFYDNPTAVPPRVIFLLMPSVLLFVWAFTTKQGQAVIQQIDLQKYYYLHTIRIGVELVLLGLFYQKLIPASMTFEGRNFDILSGLTAPFIAYWGFNQPLSKTRKVLIVWNVVALLLVIQVVVIGVLSAPTVFQQLSFDQPNRGVLYFPFVWLPSVIVPIVIFGHVVSIQRLLKDR
jgi:hypothetical protein